MAGFDTKKLDNELYVDFIGDFTKEIANIQEFHNSFTFIYSATC